MSPGQIFKLRLAVNLGKSLKEINGMSFSEYQSWATYDATELLPDRRIELQLAEIAYLIAATNAKTPSRYQVSDFMPSAKPKTQTPEDLLRTLRDGQ